MPDILIRGIEMPKNCMACSDPYEPFSMHRKCHVDGHVFCYSYVHGRDKDCPLVELPEHGDLIDRDAIPYSDTYWGLMAAEDQIDRLPVIVPASEEATNG